MKITDRIQPLIKFFKIDLWNSDFRDFSRLKKLLVNLVKLGVIVTKGFLDDDLPLRSSALSFATILGIVPFLALTFSILKGFGVHDFLEPIILNKVAFGSQDVVSRIFNYINNTNAKSLGAGGLAILVITVLYIVKNIELSFNKIWGVKSKRTFFRSFSDYLSVIVIGPIFIFAAVSLTTAVKIEGTVVLQKMFDAGYFPRFIITIKEIFPKLFYLTPYFFMWFLFTFIYLFMPNTKVRLTSALVGGVIGGTLWQIASHVYISFQFSMSKYNAIYGSMAQLPILLLWIYISWVIILFGAEVSFAFQNLRTFRQESRSLSMSQAYKENLALRISLLIARDFQTGQRSTAGGISGELNVPMRLVNEILYELTSAGIFAEAGKGQLVYLPAKDLQSVKLSDIVESVRHYGIETPIQNSTSESEYVNNLSRSMDESIKNIFSVKSLRQAASELYK